jgi:2-hydroxy-6-oxonona-2,4-dienedioate hydrolase
VDRRRFLAAALALPGTAIAQCVGVELATLRSVFTQVNGLTMHALVCADRAPPGAPALVLVHGSGLSGCYMVPTATELVNDFHVYVPDSPGYGKSGDAGEVLDVPGLADWLEAWMAAIGLERAALLGNSFGCQIIADHAARYPRRVSHALLQGPTTPPDERSVFWQFVRWRQNQGYNPEWLGDVTMQAYEQAGLWRLVRGFHFQITDRIEDKMARIEAPVLVIRGEHDPITRQEFAEHLVRLAPRGELAVIPEVAHTLVSVAPVALARVVRDYLRGGDFRSSGSPPRS